MDDGSGVSRENLGKVDIRVDIGVDIRVDIGVDIRVDIGVPFS